MCATACHHGVDLATSRQLCRPSGAASTTRPFPALTRWAKFCRPSGPYSEEILKTFGSLRPLFPCCYRNVSNGSSERKVAGPSRCSGRSRTVNEVPRRQSTGRCCPPEMSSRKSLRSGKEEVFEEEREDRVEAGRETAKENSGARPSRGVPNCSILRCLFMVAPKFSVASDACHG